MTPVRNSKRSAVPVVHVRLEPNVDRDWRARARCNGMNPELWFPVNEIDAERGVFECFRCPVMTECASYAIANREQYGTWGSLTEQDRQRLGVPRAR